MKIIKAHKNPNGHFQLMVDIIPKLTYEKVGASYVGSDDEGCFSDYLRYERASGRFVAFAGREITIEMKDGTRQVLKDHWWDSGNYDKEHKYIGIGLSTLEHLQNCFVFCSYNINEQKLNEMIEEYLKNDTFYAYYDIEKWAKLQYNWYPLIFHGRQLPFLMNYKGDIIDSVTKERKYAMSNYLKVKKGKRFSLKLFELKYNNGDRLIKLEDKYDNVVKESLPEEQYLKYKSLKVN